jgi:HEAT repeat protein
VAAQATHIVVLRVDKVSREKQVIVFARVADLKGADWPEVVKHQLTDGFHPRQARTVLDWAEPGALAVCFQVGNGCLTCIGGYWYQCAAREAPWWTMTTGRPDLCYAYSGSAARLRDHVTAMLAGRGVVVPALKYEVLALAPGPGKWTERRIEHWATYEAVSSGRLMRGREWPVWRLRASLTMPQLTYTYLQESLTGKANGIVGDGSAGPDEVPGLVRALRQEDAGTRLQAAEDLALLGGPAAEAVPTLLALARNDPDRLVRVAAATAVAALDPNNESAVALLTDALKDEAGKVRKRAAQALGDLGPGARTAVAALGRAVKDPDPTARWAAVDALGLVGPDAEAAVPVLVEALQDADSRAAAVDALGLIGRKAVAAIPALERMLKEEPAVRWPTAAALVRIGGPGARAGLRVLLRADSVPGRSRYDATNILMAPACREALPELIAAVHEPGVRDLAAEIAGGMSAYLRKEQVPDGVRKLLREDDPAVRCVAAWFLYGAGRGMDLPEVIAVQRQTLTASDPWARRQAVGYLGALGPSARDAAEALTALLQDKDEGVRDAAARALKAIRQP